MIVNGLKYNITFIMIITLIILFLFLLLAIFIKIVLTYINKATINKSEKNIKLDKLKQEYKRMKKEIKQEKEEGK